MLPYLKKKLLGNPRGVLSLCLRLLKENGRDHWRQFALALFWMIVAAACIAASAYLIGHAINEAYVNRSFAGIASVAIGIIVIFTMKGVSSCRQALVLAKIKYHINAENQRRMFDKLLRQDFGFFSNKHSSEVTARIAFCSGTAANVLNILITTPGREAMTLIGLVVIMMIQNPHTTIRGADVIHVLDHGAIVESGRHDSLLRQGRRYADFYHSQFANPSSPAVSLVKTAP